MYSFLLVFHNWNRWLLLALLVVILVRSLRGLGARATWTASDQQLGFWLLVSTHLQLVFGLVLYFVSPVTSAALANMGAAMKNPDLRYFAVEHLTVMLLGVILITVGRIRAKRALTNIAKHRTQLIWYGIALVLILLRTPFFRPLLRM